MTEKVLGKIVRAEFGKVNDMPFLFGLKLDFGFDGGGVSDGGKYTVNISEHCKWETQSRQEAIEKLVDSIHKLLNDAKVDDVSELVGKPVEITLENSWFKDFRILTEVL